MNPIKSVAIALLAVLPVFGFADAVTNVTWKSSLSAGATFKNGNTDSELYTMNFKGDRYAPKSDWINSLYGEYGETESTQTEGQVRGQSDYRYKFGSENFFGGIFSEGYHDALKQVHYRVKMGPNIGYYFINKEDMKLDASIGINYVHQRTAEGIDNFAEYRGALNYLWEITETASYYMNIEYSANVEDTRDSNGLFVTGLKSKVSTKLSMFIEYRDDYDNLPAENSGVTHNDSTVLAGLTYDIM